ncbi:binding-protein-dependent transport systems inner membrane component [Sulfobacillus acidophilus TPY]|uniref:Carbohydrate ABC transporter membrane protein 1, CUT1 family n=1 Tax=Sulfobacillus acidophilus (strain ATCC 700253 / DSM 10332 / NAL) TaxID=679936 RepID=G8TTI9_SULAD|nr:binding-protein-dependent transport systems inner membrane component [Sulfobacillus acidophilus TPY]AEW05655.1 carbohydrate ABC transporter membrane protein 1, CUT1 family [Sulfobacillus acidophilus DSM 10332]
MKILMPHSRRRRLAARYLVYQGWAFALPGLLIIIAITIFPILYSIYISFNHVALTTNGFQLFWVGLHNYRIVLSNSLFRYSLVFTVIYTIVTVMVELVLGMGVALVLNAITTGRGFMLALLLLPWSLITVISAEVWSYIYNGVYGVLNALLIGIGLLHHPVTWLGTPVLAIASMMVADIWKTTPFVAIILLAGLQMIPDELYEAASIDGASPGYIFWKITVPLLRPTIALSVLFRVLQAFGVFDLPFVLTGGGPGHATESLAMLGYQVMFQDLNMGRGAAIAASTTLIVLLASLFVLRVFRAQVEEEAS